MSNDPEQEYFSDGMTEEIIGALAKLEGLKVISRTSAFYFKHRFSHRIYHKGGNALGTSRR